MKIAYKKKENTKFKLKIIRIKLFHIQLYINFILKKY